MTGRMMFEGLKKWWNRECEGDAILFSPPLPKPTEPPKPIEPEPDSLIEEVRKASEKARIEKEKEDEIKRQEATPNLYNALIYNIKQAAQKGHSTLPLSYLTVSYAVLGTSADLHAVFDMLRKDGFTTT